MNDLPVLIMLVENEEYIMNNNDNDREGPATESLNQYYKRKQSTNKNRVSAEAEMPIQNARDDYDAEQRQSNWKGRDKANDEGTSIWDDSAWKDKDQHGR